MTYKQGMSINVTQNIIYDIKVEKTTTDRISLALLRNMQHQSIKVNGTPASIHLIKSFHCIARVSHGLIHITDWLPTFFALAGGNPNHVVEGEGFNVWDIIDNESPPQRCVFLLFNTSLKENL